MEKFFEAIKGFVNQMDKENPASSAINYSVSGGICSPPALSLLTRIKRWYRIQEEKLTGKWSNRKKRELHCLSKQIIAHGEPYDHWEGEDIEGFYERYKKLDSVIKKFKRVFNIDVYNMTNQDMTILAFGIDHVVCKENPIKGSASG